MCLLLVLDINGLFDHGFVRQHRTKDHRPIDRRQRELAVLIGCGFVAALLISPSSIVVALDNRADDRLAVEDNLSLNR